MSISADAALLALKYTGSIFAALYGVYATLTDFKKEQNGKKVLTRKGYIGISLLVLSTTLNLSSGGIKDMLDRREAAVERDQRKQLLADEKTVSDSLSKQLKASKDISDNLGSALKQLTSTSQLVQKNAVTTTAVLNETQRLRDPLESIVNIGIELKVPLDQDGVRPYVKRLRLLYDERFGTEDPLPIQGNVREEDRPKRDLGNEWAPGRLTGFSDSLLTFRKAHAVGGVTISVPCAPRLAHEADDLHRRNNKVLVTDDSLVISCDTSQFHSRVLGRYAEPKGP